MLKDCAKDIPDDKRGLLLIDNYEGHMDKDIEQSLNVIRIDVLRLPPNSTSILQAMDISVNAPFKTYYAEQWDEYQYQLDSKPLTTSGKFKAPTREQKLAWVSEAWARISTSTIRRGFKPYLEAIKEGEEQQMEEDKALAQYEGDLITAMYEEDSDNSARDSDEDTEADEFDDASISDLLSYEIC